MRRLYLHIGLGKTGSSALQSWLSINSAELARQGIVYADLSAAARAGKASSGNGVQLVNALRDSDFTEIERLLQTVYFPPGVGETAIISSELLKDVRPPKLRELHALFARLEIEPHIVAYVRSVYERLYSTWGQRVKNLGHTEPFAEADIARGMLTTLAWLRKYQDQFGSAMTVLNYDAPDADIYQSFATLAGIDTATTTGIEKRVNRSLSYREQEVQRQLNALHGGDFSAAIARCLIEADPEKATAVHYDPELLERTREVCRESIEWINERFNPVPALVCDLYDTRAGEALADNTDDILRTIAQWALTFEPAEAVRASFSEFLQAFAGLYTDLPAATRQALLDRARAGNL
ncbi:MAG: hypothetical protein HKN19_05680 [Halioglobus sp.]|nr:hypothetical protein [Halioglobus sp.]